MSTISNLYKDMIDYKGLKMLFSKSRLTFLIKILLRKTNDN